VISKSQSQEYLEIAGPFAVIFDEEKKMYAVYNIDEEKHCEWKIED
jgi:hypothetical protein